MKQFNIWRSRMYPQCFITVVRAPDIETAWRYAKEQNILNPIVGEVK